MACNPISIFVSPTTNSVGFNTSSFFDGKYKKLEDLETMLYDCCIGSIAEIYDAEEPRKAKGAFSQAWSVAEVLRIIS